MSPSGEVMVVAESLVVVASVDKSVVDDFVCVETLESIADVLVISVGLTVCVVVSTDDEVVNNSAVVVVV